MIEGILYSNGVNCYHKYFVLIPLLTEAIHQRNQVLMNRYANASIKITVLISSAAGIGLINLLPLMNRLFKNDSLTGTLSIYMITVVCVSLIMMNIALLQVLNRIRPILVGNRTLCYFEYYVYQSAKYLW